MSEITSAMLVDSVRRGDEDAADALFERHAARLLSLAKSRLSARLGRRVDAEDIVQSAMESFFRGARRGRYSFARRGDLWRLLAAITLNKVREKAKYHGAGRRSIDSELAALPEGDALPSARDSVGDDLLVSEEIEWITEGMAAPARRVVELRLAGYQYAEIADDVCRSERTIQRWMEDVQNRLRRRLADFQCGTA